MPQTYSGLLVERLRSPEVNERRVALTELHESFELIDADELLPLLRDEDATVRRLVIGVLEELGDASAIPAILDAVRRES